MTPNPYLGEFEQMVVLAVLQVGEGAYAVPVRALIESRAKRSVARGALYTALERLEAKGCLRSQMSDPGPERGGRSRRYFTVTPEGLACVEDVACRHGSPRQGSRVSARAAMSSTRPPRLAERLLAAALRDPAWRDAVVGDLHEEFVHRRAATDSLRASAWYWWQAIRLAAHFDRHRRLDAPRTRQPRAGTGDTVMQDLRFAIRMLIKRPGLTFAVVTALALGLGANSAVFSVVDALVLRPFPFADVDRMALIASTAPRRDNRRESVTPADFLDWREQVEAFEYMAAADWWDASLGGPDLPERVQGFHVSATYFSIFGVTPIAGRAFRAEDERPGAPRSLVMGHGLWMRRFGGDRSIVGKTVNVDREPYVVLGIAPPGFAVLQGAEIWAPLTLAGDDASNRQAQYLTVFGRLRPERTLDDAATQLSVIAARLAEEHPATNKSRSVRVYSLADGPGR